jgi:hypothetical protein
MSARARDRHVGAPVVAEEADGAARVTAHKRDHDRLLLATLKSVDTASTQVTMSVHNHVTHANLPISRAALAGSSASFSSRT